MFLGLGLKIFLCPWPRALCPRLLLCLIFSLDYVETGLPLTLSQGTPPHKPGIIWYFTHRKIFTIADCIVNAILVTITNSIRIGASISVILVIALVVLLSSLVSLREIISFFVIILHLNIVIIC